MYDDVTEDEVLVYKEMFATFDVNGDGSVQLDELRSALKVWLTCYESFQMTDKSLGLV